MIQFTVWKSRDQYRGFESAGHAGYAAMDEDDIICAAVSALTINAVNSIYRRCVRAGAGRGRRLSPDLFSGRAGRKSIPADGQPCSWNQEH